MERLSSCYFCGDAVDAPLETYPLVPDDHEPSIDTDREVVLCPTCRRKLTTVLEHVIEAAFDGTTDADPSADILTDVDAGESMIATDVERIDDRSRGGDAGETDTAAEDATDDGDARAEEEEATDPGGVDARAGGRDDGETEWVTPGTDAGRNGSGDPDAETDGSRAATDRGTEASEADETNPHEDDESVEADAGDGTAGPTPDSETGGESASGTTPGDGATGRSASGTAGRSAEGGDGDYSRSEYNKIVRLLQNREFPVEIDEITVVARNAYGIDERTCHAVLNALVDRGVIDDRGETLVKT